MVAAGRAPLPPTLPCGLPSNLLPQLARCPAGRACKPPVHRLTIGTAAAGGPLVRRRLPPVPLHHCRESAALAELTSP